MKGVSETLNVMMVIILIAIFAAILFLTRIRGAGQNTQTFGDALIEQESKTLLNSLYAVHYPIIDADNEELMWVLRFACAYGSKKEGEFVVSKSIPVLFNAETFTENYLEQKIGKNFYFYAGCPNNKLEYGKKPPEGKKVLANKVMVPLPGGGYGEFFIQRW